MLFYLLCFILLLGPLVFVHELGHFIFAKLFHVRVDAFSMGFGPKLFKKKWGETEYCLSLIPLGGYVKLYGQDPNEAVDSRYKNRALNNLNPWKRFLVFVAGPLFNFLFAIIVFAVMLILGEPHASPVVGRVVPGSQAANAGFRTGDVIAAIDRSIITSFEEVAKKIADSPNKPLTVRVKRKNIRELKVTPRSGPGLNLYGEITEVGSIDGLYNAGRAAVVGISNPNSIAAKAGLKSGDQILSFNGKEVLNFEELQDQVQEALKISAPKFTLGIAHKDIKTWLGSSTKLANKSEAEIQLPALPLAQLGIYSSELFIASLVADSPAQKAGLQPEDRLIAVNNNVLTSFTQLRDFVQQVGEQRSSLVLHIERLGKQLRLPLTPISSEASDLAGNEVKQFMIGIYPLFIQASPQYFTQRTFNPFTLTVESWSRALDLSAKTFISVKKLIFREVSVSTLGGPILIGKIAGDSMLRGVAQFLRVMAMISISLAIFNVLPIPILDGGHIFLLFIEVIRGKPFSLRQSEMVQQIGLSLIVLLLVVVIFNDVSRVGIPALKQFFQ